MELSPPNPARFAVLAWFCLAAIVAYLQRMAIGVSAEDIQRDLKLTPEDMGLVMSCYYWTYAIGQLPAGWLGQRFGTRRMLPVTIGLTSLCCGGVAMAATGSQFAAVWLMAGLMVAGIFPCCIQSITRWFPSDQRAFPSGSLGSSMSIGGAVSTALTGWLLVEFATSDGGGWRTIFALYAVPGLLWAAAFPWWFRESPSEAASREDGATRSAERADNDRPQDGEASAAAEWWSDPRTWLICAQQFFRAAGYIFYATWFPSYLKKTHEVTTEQAGLLTSLPLLGVVIGGACGGLVIDAIDRRTRNRRISRQLVAIVCHSLCGLLVLAASLMNDVTAAVSLIALGSMIFAVGGACSYTITMDLGGSRAATLFATMNMSGNVGAALCPIVVGYLVKYAGWDSVLYFFGGLYLAVATCWMFLDPTPRGELSSSSAEIDDA